jgi:hypothetical protein
MIDRAHVPISRDTHTAFKKHCRERGITMKKYIDLLLTAETKDPTLTLEKGFWSVKKRS